MNKTLVTCFSPTGNTLAVAREIASLTSGDLFNITPAVPYSAADLDWNNPKSRSSVEMKDPASRPEIADKLTNLADYQPIFLGFPVWWYDAPHIILTFLGSHDFSGKVIFPFVTSGSSGLGKIPQTLQTACPKANWQPGIRFPEHPAKEAVEAWVKEQHAWKN